MSFYQDNIKVLQEMRPQFYELYEEALQDRKVKYPCEEILSREAKDGSIIFCVKREGQTVRLNSPYRPLQEAEKWALQFSGDNILVNAMLFGFGNGMFPRALLQRLQRDAKLFIVEPNIEIFCQAMEQQDVRDLLGDERVLLCLEDINPDDFYDLLRKNTHWTNLDTQIVCHHTGYETLFQEAYRDFLLAVKKTSQMVQVNKDTQAHFAKRIVPNMIQNMLYIKEARILSDYVDMIPNDIPAIIVAAGPSLDKNIGELRRAKGKAFIIAVDTVMNRLTKEGILPDAMVTMDPGKSVSYMNQPEYQHLPLFCILEANHQILELHQGTKIWLQGNSLLGELFSKYGKQFTGYNPGGSVATAAFSICASLKFERIVLVGQDLAYQGEVTHAGGAKRSILNEKYGIKMIEGIDGKPVKSRHDWIIYLDWFEEAIADIKEETEVINATEGGAMIHGAKVMKLEDVINGYCNREVDVESILNEMPPMFTEEEYALVAEEIRSYAAELSEMIRTAELVEKDCKKALRLLEKDPENIKLNRLQKRVLEATKQIGGYASYNLVDIYMSKTANRYLSGVFVVSEDNHQDELHMFRSSQMIFQGVADAAKELLPMFEEMTEQL